MLSMDVCVCVYKFQLIFKRFWYVYLFLFLQTYSAYYDFNITMCGSGKVTPRCWDISVTSSHRNTHQFVL